MKADCHRVKTSTGPTSVCVFVTTKRTLQWFFFYLVAVNSFRVHWAMQQFNIARSVFGIAACIANVYSLQNVLLCRANQYIYVCLVIFDSLCSPFHWSSVSGLNICETFFVRCPTQQMNEKKKSQTHTIEMRWKFLQQQRACTRTHIFYKMASLLAAFRISVLFFVAFSMEITIWSHHLM